MSRLEELIAEYCPDGVESIPMGSLMTRIRERGKNAPEVSQVYSVSNTLGMVCAEDYRDNTIHSEDTSNYTVVRKGMVAYNPSRLNIGSIAMLKSDIPGLVSPMYVVFSIDETIVRLDYFEYLMHSALVANKIDSFKEEGARFRFDYSRWNWIMVQIPPLPVQREIVRILDNFTELTVELTAELTARKKQYEYYRDQFLDSSGDSAVEWMTLDSVTEFIRNGLNYKADGSRTKRYKISRIETISTGSINMEKVGSADTISDNYLLHDGDILFSHINSLPYLGNIAYYDEQIGELYHGMNLLCFRSKKSVINPKYLYYFMKSRTMRNYIERYAKHSCNQYSLSTSDIKKWIIPVPSLSEQSKIVAMIDRFNILCTSITDGLPAEIRMRQKQYEYYREKLLIFEKKEGC